MRRVSVDKRGGSWEGETLSFIYESELIILNDIIQSVNSIKSFTLFLDGRGSDLNFFIRDFQKYLSNFYYNNLF